MLNLMRNSDNDLYLFVIFIYNFFLNIIKKNFIIDYFDFRLLYKKKNLNLI